MHVSRYSCRGILNKHRVRGGGWSLGFLWGVVKYRVRGGDWSLGLWWRVVKCGVQGCGVECGVLMWCGEA